MAKNVETEALAELVRLNTVSANPDSQIRALQMVQSIVAGSPGAITVTDVGGAQPYALLSNDADPRAERLLFACHVDTVPVPDAGRWQFEPWSAEIADGRLHGRGTSDMKAGVIAAASAFRHAVESGVPAALLLTSDEEIGSLGAAAALHSLGELRIGAAIVPEATGNRIVTGHRGALWLQISASGKNAHGSTPHLGENAALKLAAALLRAETELPLQQNEALGKESWNLGLLQSGIAPNVVPDRAQATIDMRVISDGAHLREWWANQPEIADVATRIQLAAVHTDTSDPWVQALPAPRVDEPAAYFTDASVFAGSLQPSPVVIWGPGTPAVMHADNEYVEISEIDECIGMYCSVVDSWADQSAHALR
ncbi:succinyl-diaminopimelate desuccinylase [Antricoccus suffuscus]|uniref:Succinyl-diaminopimelate desuccinylase n=1 Tax=Antricoccus suffuscus TaxID=1629062 RepID=A0A2T0ZW26_9ACTN|nr:M20/M25/M40 family metallo-hydrolase [Antricoccus suffuscus]PRZ40561.1 succinyl-diaminopimelate desuccinylase [Antricoccus suffuscus]